MTVAELITALDNPVEVVLVHEMHGDEIGRIRQYSFDEPYRPGNSAWVILDELYGIPERYHNWKVRHFRIYKLDRGNTQAMDLFIEE